MSDENTADQLRQELEDVEQELAELRRLGGDAAARRGRDSDTSEGYVEPEDIATQLTGIAENEAIIDTLQQRRERIQEQLKALG
jgi:chaperonin cofactor prefoldin